MCLHCSTILTNLLEKDPEDDVFAAKGHDLDDDWKPNKSDFSRCIFIWHIATGLVYYDDQYKHRRDMGGSHRKISKVLSDYMLYLVLLRPMMLPKGHGEVINKETSRCAENFFPQDMRKLVADDKKQFVAALMSYECLIIKPKGGNSMDVLEEGRVLAKKLQSLVSRELDHEEKWEMISEVWMRLMIKAANHCLWKEHAQQLRHGGELLTHIALLMAHLGLSTKICILHDEPYPF